MKFKTDENMPVEAAEDLRQAGHDAVTVANKQLTGHPMSGSRKSARPRGGPW